MRDISYNYIGKEEKEGYTDFDLGDDLRSSPYIKEKCKSSKSYAQNLYAALCNNVFQKIDVLTILYDRAWACSWRRAGSLISDIIDGGDYMDWYCSGINEPETLEHLRYVTEAHVTDEIKEDLKRLGWTILRNNE